MKFSKPQPAATLAQLVGGKVLGDPNHAVTGINEIHRVEAGDLTFVDVEKYFKKALGSKADTILINQEVAPPAGKVLIYVADPFSAFNQLTEHFRPRTPLSLSGPTPSDVPGLKLGRNVVLGENVVIGPNVEIGHNVVIGSNVQIGAGTLIYPNVTVYDNTQIGEGCTLQAGVVLGGEAFYYKRRDWGREKMLSKGNVILENYVEVGANSTIDRGVTSPTSIGEHTKIDNLVQIGHDTVIGKRCILAALVGVAGACTIEDDCVIWGQVGIPSGVTIGKGAVLMAKSGVISSLEGGKVYAGMPATEWMHKLRVYASIDRLPELIQKLEASGKA